MMENASSGSLSEHENTALRQEDTVSLVKSIITSEFKDLKKQLLEKPVNSLKRKSEEEKTVSLKYNGNQKQFDFNCSFIEKLGHLKCSLEESTIEDIESDIEKVIRDIRSRNKLIKIADRTEGGWGTVEEYETCDYADDSDDDRKIRQANSRALQKKRRLQPRRSSTVTSNDNSRVHLFRGQHKGRSAGPLDICFRCGLGGHFRRDCRAQISGGMPQDYTIQQQLLPYPQSIAWGSAALPTTQAGARKTGN